MPTNSYPIEKELVFITVNESLGAIDTSYFTRACIFISQVDDDVLVAGQYYNYSTFGEVQLSSLPIDSQTYVCLQTWFSQFQGGGNIRPISVYKVSTVDGSDVDLPALTVANNILNVASSGEYYAFSISQSLREFDDEALLPLISTGLLINTTFSELWNESTTIKTHAENQDFDFKAILQSKFDGTGIDFNKLPKTITMQGKKYDTKLKLMTAFNKVHFNQALKDLLNFKSSTEETALFLLYGIDFKVFVCVSNDAKTFTSPASSILAQIGNNYRVFGLYSANVNDNPDIASLVSGTGYTLDGQVGTGNNYSMNGRYVYSTQLSGTNGDGLTQTQATQVKALNSNYISWRTFAGGITQNLIAGGGFVMSGKPYISTQNYDWLVAILTQAYADLLLTRTNLANSVSMNLEGANDVEATGNGVMDYAFSVKVLMSEPEYPVGYKSIRTPITPVMKQTGNYTGQSYENANTVFMISISTTITKVN